jgi:hypothetical protein
MGTPRLLEPPDQMRNVQRSANGGAELAMRFADGTGEYSID